MAAAWLTCAVRIRVEKVPVPEAYKHSNTGGVLQRRYIALPDGEGRRGVYDESPQVAGVVRRGEEGDESFPRRID